MKKVANNFLVPSSPSITDGALHLGYLPLDVLPDKFIPKYVNSGGSYYQQFCGRAFIGVGSNFQFNDDYYVYRGTTSNDCILVIDSRDPDEELLEVPRFVPMTNALVFEGFNDYVPKCELDEIFLAYVLSFIDKINLGPWLSNDGLSFGGMDYLVDEFLKRGIPDITGCNSDYAHCLARNFKSLISNHCRYGKELPFHLSTSINDVMNIKIAELVNAYFNKEISLRALRNVLTLELSGNDEFAPLLVAVSTLRRKDVFQYLQKMAEASPILNEKLVKKLP